MQEVFSINMLYGVLVAGFVSWMTIPPIVRVAREKHLVAITNGRTNHKGSIPALGGVAIFASVTLAGLLFLPQNLMNEFRYIGFAVLTMFMIGIKDDLVEVRARYKLIAQIVVALVIIIIGDIRIHTLFGFFGIFDLPDWISIAISTILFVGIVNSINLIDGIDGLASGLGIQISLIFGIVLAYLNQPSYAILSFVFMGSLIPFYIFNVFGKSYKLFMGDTGSLILGTVFGILALKICCCSVPEAFFLEEIKLPILVVAVLIIPVADAVKVIVVRMLNGVSPFIGDMNHLHHTILSLGMTHWKASTLIFVMNLFIVGFVLIFRELNEALLLSLVVFMGASAVTVPWFIIGYRAN